MRLKDIRAYHVECELPEAVRNSTTIFRTRSSLVVELVTDDGLSGWGETQSPAASWAYIEAVLARRILGQDPFDSTRLFRAMLGERNNGNGDIAMLGISAIDMALWDIQGRATGEPISRLLGGRLRDRVTAYASGPFMRPDGDPYRDFGRDIDSFLKAGFRALKVRSGVTPRQDGAALIKARRQIGPDMPLMLDFNRGYTVAAAIEAARCCEEAGLLWIEEPLGVDDFAGYQRLAACIGTPLAAGEGLGSLTEFRTLLSTRAVDVIQPDLFRCGGFTGAQRIAALCEAFDTPYTPHIWGTVINFYASMQMAAVLAPYRIQEEIAFPLFEWDQGLNPLITLLGEPHLNGDGTLTVPDEPGIGVDISADLFAPYVRKSYRAEL